MRRICQVCYAHFALRHTHIALENERMTIGNEIRRRRKALKWTIEELAYRIGTDSGNLSRLERGKQGYKHETLLKIAGALGCSVSDLFAESDQQVLSVPLGFRRIPIISYSAIIDWVESAISPATSETEKFLFTERNLSIDAFAVEVKDNSMLPEFKPGDRIIVDPDIVPKPGDFVIARCAKEKEATFRKYRPRGKGADGKDIYVLTPLNEDYPSTRSDVVSIALIGVVIEWRRYRAVG